MSNQMNRQEILRQKLTLLRTEHRDLDTAITSMEQDRMSDQVTLKRLKKRKLALRDEIARIEDELTPDIIA